MNIQAFLMWGFSALFYFYENLLQVIPSIMKPELTKVFGLNSEAFGHLTALCFYTYGLMQIPAGLLVDRFGSKSITIWASLLCALGCLIFAIAEALWVAQLGRILMGIGGSFAFVNTMKIAILHFSARWTTLLLGFTVTAGFLGSMVGLSWMSQFIEHVNWRFIILGCGAAGFALSFFIWFFTREQTLTLKEKTHQIVFSFYKLKTLEGLSYLLSRKTTWIAAFYGCLMFVPTQIFGASWGISFFYEAHGLQRTSSGILCALIYGGWIIGAPLWGWIASYYRNHYYIMGFATLITLLLCMMITYINPLPTILVFPLLFGLGLFSSAYMLVFVIIQAMTPVQFSGTALGVVNSINSLSALADPLVGAMLDKVPSPAGLVEYQFAFLIIPIMLLVSLPLLFYLAILDYRVGLPSVSFKEIIEVE